MVSRFPKWTAIANATPYLLGSMKPFVGVVHAKISYSKKKRKKGLGRGVVHGFNIRSPAFLAGKTLIGWREIIQFFRNALPFSVYSPTFVKMNSGASPEGFQRFSLSHPYPFIQ